MLDQAITPAVAAERLRIVALPSERPGMGAIPYEGGTAFRVWAPFARTVHVAGTFNGWSTEANPLAAENDGRWSCDSSVHGGGGRALSS